MIGIELALDPARLSEPILGWRAWTLTGSPRGEGLTLLPIGRTRPAWRPREAAEATCPRRRAHAGVPGADCRCGLHAMQSAEPLRRARSPAVLGRVALWGRVIEHERGYRARFGYPQRLRLVCPLCLWRWGVAASEACRVVVRHRGGRMVPLCGPHLELGRRYGYPMPARLDAAAVEAALLAAYAVELLPRELTRPACRGSGAGPRPRA